MKILIYNILRFVFRHKIILIYTPYPQPEWKYFKRRSFAGWTVLQLYRMNQDFYVAWIF
jgi:hypothetical protein